MLARKSCISDISSRGNKTYQGYLEKLPMDIVEFANDIVDFNLKLLVNKARSKSRCHNKDR